MDTVTVGVLRWAIVRLNLCLSVTEWRARLHFSASERKIADLRTPPSLEYVIILDLKEGGFDVSSRLPIEDFSRGVALYSPIRSWGGGEVDSGPGVSGRFFQRFCSSEGEGLGPAVGVFLDFPSRRISHFFLKGEGDEGIILKKSYK